MCDDHFDEEAALIICRSMGYDCAASWDKRTNWEIQNNYKIVLDDVTCSVKGNRNFEESCTWRTESDCSHEEDIHLTCGMYIKNGIIIFMCRHAKSCDVVSSHEPTELGLLQMAK